MKRHLDRKKKCIMSDNNKNDIDFIQQSLIKHYIKDELKCIIKNKDEDNTDIENIEYKCSICNKIYHNKSNLNKHQKNVCFKYKEGIITVQNIIQQNN
jgi:hypothetical protein